MGSDGLWTDFKGHRAFDRFTDNEAAFIADRDSFYMATVSETGWPYVQHRGGPRGFLKLSTTRPWPSPTIAAIASISASATRPQMIAWRLILMDYARRARLKIYARLESVPLDADQSLTDLVTIPDYRAKLERIVLLRLETFDWNCPQHITPRFTQQEIDGALSPLRERLAELEAENATLLARLARHGTNNALHSLDNIYHPD